MLGHLLRRLKLFPKAKIYHDTLSNTYRVKFRHGGYWQYVEFPENSKHNCKFWLCKGLATEFATQEKAEFAVNTYFTDLKPVKLIY